MGEEGPPFEAIRLQVCERMHWTFADFDATPAADIFVLLEIWRLQDLDA